MNGKSVFLLVLVMIINFVPTITAQNIQNIQWMSTTEIDPWAKKDIKALSMKASSSIEIDLQRVRQTIDGFGGCFNEIGWDALNSIPYAEKRDILSNLFDQVSGCKFNICRMPLGANDYAVNWYSYNETPGDYEMEHFSIARDRLRLIPYINEAKEFKPDLKIWASPWCPPLWMKQNKHYACRIDTVKNTNDLTVDKQGKEMENLFIMDEKTLSAYALYFSKFIKGYRKEGIDVYAVHVQNEPNSCQNFPSCTWTPEGLATLIKYVGKQFKEDALETEIWLGTIERPHPERVDLILNDPEVRKYIAGVGFQWGGKGVIEHVSKTYPDLKLMQTETVCGNGSNDWKALENTFSLMKHYFENGANSYMYWNMVLDHTGRSSWGWKQNSMITVTEDLEVIYNPEFYLMKHFSYFIEPTASFIDVSSDENCLAFLNPDNRIVIIYYNEMPESITKDFKIGENSISLELPGKSLNTFLVPME